MFINLIYNDGRASIVFVLSILNGKLLHQYNSTTHRHQTNNLSPSSFLCPSDNTTKKKKKKKNTTKWSDDKRL